MNISMFSERDVFWMQTALQLAAQAEKNQEVPVGAVLVADEQIVGEGWNQPISQHDPTAHAEVIALRAAAQKKQNYRLVHSTLYVTLEPCLMCVGAIVHARVQRVVYGALDPKTGAVASVFQLGATSLLNHRVEYMGGVLRDECSELLKKFFRARR